MCRGGRGAGYCETRGGGGRGNAAVVPRERVRTLRPRPDGVSRTDTSSLEQRAAPPRPASPLCLCPCRRWFCREASPVPRGHRHWLAPSVACAALALHPLSQGQHGTPRHRDPRPHVMTHGAAAQGHSSGRTPPPPLPPRHERCGGGVRGPARQIRRNGTCPAASVAVPRGESRGPERPRVPPLDPCGPPPPRVPSRSGQGLVSSRPPHASAGAGGQRGTSSLLLFAGTRCDGGPVLTLCSAPQPGVH